MKLSVIGSGSTGNCYILKSDTGKTLIMEAGLTWSNIQKALQFNYINVEGCIITHEHKDHCKAAKDVAKAGINVYASQGTINAIGLSKNRFAKICKVSDPLVLGEFKIMGFDVKHDAADPFGFLIQHKECGTVLFLTDTYYVEYKFPDINNIIIEANYDADIMNGKNAPGFLKNRIIKSHMSINTTVKMLNNMDLKNVNNIVLCHLSNTNSNEDDFLLKTVQATGCKVHIANKGKVIPFDKTPF